LRPGSEKEGITQSPEAEMEMAFKFKGIRVYAYVYDGVFIYNCRLWFGMMLLLNIGMGLKIASIPIVIPAVMSKLLGIPMKGTAFFVKSLLICKYFFRYLQMNSNIAYGKVFFMLVD
jgi:hypothetical protein